MTGTQAEAMLIGLALGDALGAPVEFLSLDDIWRRYGINGITEPPDPALYTDDTQMTLALVEALLEDISDTDEFMAAVGQHFIIWLDRQANPAFSRAPGNTCMAGIARYQNGMPWQQSGIAESKGCGSAMRVAPIGYLFQDDAQRLKEFALASGDITHRHPAARAACVAGALMVKLALDGLHPDEWFAPILDLTDGISDEFDAAILRVGHVEGWGNTDDALRHIGAGWVGEEAIAMALYCVRRFPDNYTAGVRLAANIDGDSDSVACIVGGILGARLGLGAIPIGWQNRCENRYYMQALAQKLATLKKELG